ncbi:MAG: heavy metal translocating P-type ATPase [Thiomonas sp. 20-64-9]|jgi:Cu2+-exporting ATPase|nr:MAG: heavy metal translocating P-type ATPase [Thiomonas sp. 20-64-9]OZB69583.1 MAG: heavy metal translocating P-type ATPase [Thiomonas sp. 13-64-67]
MVIMSSSILPLSGAPNQMPKLPAEATGCYHCSLPLGDAPVRMELDGQWRSFCCQGCAAAAEIIVQGGLCAYYDRRTAGEGALAALPREEIDKLHQQWMALADPAFLSAYATSLGEGRWSTQIAVDGIHCGACVWLIEQRLRAIPGVLAATVNYSTRRVALQWDANTVQLAQVFQALAEVGYRPLPNARHQSELNHRRARRLAILRTLVAWLAMMQVMMFAWPGYLDAEGLNAAEQGIFQWGSLALTLPALLFSGWPFLMGALRDVRNRRLGMDVPVTLGLWSAFAASVWSVLHGQSHVYFDSVVMFLALLLTARLIEDGLRQRSLNAAEELMEQLPAAVRVRASGEEDWRSVAITQVRAGDEVELPSGSAAAVDGVVISGASLVDEALLNGESHAVPKQAGDAILAGSMNRQSPLIVRATQTGAGTRIAQMVELMQHALASKPRSAQLADIAAQWFTLGLLAVAALTVLLWWWLDPARIVPTLVAVLVVSCPCALSLAVPAALAASTAQLSRHGVLLARGHALDRAPQVDLWLFDKTGTLTTAEPVVSAVRLLDPSYSREQVLALARALEQGVQHPLARAFMASAAQGDAVETVQDLRAVPHGGMQGVWQGQTLRLGHAAFSGVAQAQPPEVSDIPLTRLGLSLDGRALAVFDIAETLRPGAQEALQSLQAAGAEVAVLSGDAVRTVQAWAAWLGVARAEGGLSPEDKLERVRQWRAQGRVVAMVGDGVNDAPVLAAADLSVSFAGAAPIARAGADVILHHPDMRALPRLVATGRRTVGVMRQNLIWAVVYNLLAIPLAVAGFITPVWAAVGMSTSSLLVVLNAARLARRDRVAPTL